MAAHGLKRLAASACAALLCACGEVATGPTLAPSLQRAVPAYVAPPDGEPWLTVDIDTDGGVRYRDTLLFDPATDDHATLERALWTLRTAALEAGRTRTESAFGPWGPVELVVDTMRIECHPWSEWQAMRDFLETASDPDLGFWKIQFALMDVEAVDRRSRRDR